MRWIRHLVYFAGVLAALGGGWSPAAVNGQALECLQGSNHIPIELGTPDEEGVTVPDHMSTAAEKHGYYFSVPQRSAASLYVGDQLFDLDLYLYVRGRCPEGSWERLVRTWSARSERMVIQFVRPDEQIVNLDPATICCWLVTNTLRIRSSHGISTLHAGLRSASRSTRRFAVCHRLTCSLQIRSIPVS